MNFMDITFLVPLGCTDVVNAARGRLFCYGQFDTFEKKYFSVAFDIVVGIFLLLPLAIKFPRV